MLDDAPCRIYTPHSEQIGVNMSPESCGVHRCKKELHSPSSSLFTPPSPYQSRRNVASSASNFIPLLAKRSSLKPWKATPTLTVVLLPFLSLVFFAAKRGFLLGEDSSGDDYGHLPRASAIIAFMVLSLASCL